MNDTHSNLMPSGPRTADLEATIGGMARAATVIGTAKRSDPDLLIVHAGDISIGDLFFQKFYGVAELQMLRSLGVHVMTVGNHEFDLTPAGLLGTYAEAFAQGDPIPVVSSNLILEHPDVEPLTAFIQPNTVIDAGDVKVGFFGMLTPETMLLSQPAPAVVDTNLILIAGEQVAALRAAGCDVVVMLSHLGRYLDGIVTSYVDGIDLVVGGHDHDMMAADPLTGTTPIVQAGSFYHQVGMVELEVDNGTVSLLTSTLIDLDESVAASGPMRVAIERLADKVEETYGPVFSEKIAEANEFIPERAGNLMLDGRQDVALGNLVCEAYKEWGSTDIAIQACGSMAQPLYEGPLVGNDVFRSVGYGFNLVNGLGFRMAKFTVLGAEIMAGLEFGLSSIELNDEYFIQVSGMSYTYNPNGPAYSRLVSAMIGDQPLDPQRRYSVTANEMTLLFFSVIGITPADVVVDEELTEYLVFSEYLKTSENIYALVDGRILSTPLSTVAETNPITESWFTSEARNGVISVALDVPYAEGWSVHLYNTTLHEIPLNADVQQTDNGVRVTMPAGMLGTGIYVMTVNMGSTTRAGRVLVTR